MVGPQILSHNMEHVFNKKAVAFFENQFQRQVRDQEYTLNPFEILAFDYLAGDILDLGCGLGNLSLEAGRRGHRVMTVDASPTAVARINKDAEREGLSVRGIQADIESWNIDAWLLRLFLSLPRRKRKCR